MKLVTVEWIDSAVESEWRELDDHLRRAANANALLNVSVGYLIADENDYVVLAQTHTPGVDGKPMFGNTTQIPRCAITKISDPRRAKP